MARLFVIIFAIIAATGCSSLFSLQPGNTKKEPNSYNPQGKPHGQWIYYHDRDNNVVQSRGRFKNGIPVGRWTEYNPDGTINAKIRYFKNKAREKRYNPDGTLDKKGWSKLVLENPEEIHYYWDGKWRMYNDKGRTERVVLFRKGEVVRVIRDKNPENNPFKD
jgi:antitoxin component YwqK of YwqJK toxin-antitoxin module